jgi:hypothetical protein
VLAGPRPRGSRRPHADATVAAVRRLIEQSTLTYAEIAKRTGIAPASICRWTRNGGWRRPLFAPRATDTVPTARASAQLKARTLAARLHTLADRYVRELEEMPGVDLDKLGEALQLLKMAKLAARPRRGRGRVAAAKAAPPPLVPAPGSALRAARVQAPAGTQGPYVQDPPPVEHHARTTMRTLRAAGVDTHRVSDAALEDFVESRAPPPERHRARRGRRFTRGEYHAWMLRKE